MNTKYDVIIIGAGPGGYPCAIRLGQLGRKVLVVEEKYLGGLCLNWGCIPTKALSYAAEMTDTFTKAKRMGFDIEVKSFNIDTLRNWKQGVVKRLRSGIEFLFKSNNIDWINGFGEVISEHAVRVKTKAGEQAFEADNIVLATGTEIISLPGLEFDHQVIFDTDDALELKEIPRTMLVIGAGASGLEMATIYSRLGSQVTVVEIMDQILPGMEHELCEHLFKVMKKSGIEILTSSQVSSCTVQDSQAVVTIKKPDAETKATYDRVLVTVGRKPSQTAFKDIPLKTDKKGYLTVNDMLQTSVKTVYAIGDIVGAPLLAHKATFQGTELAEYLAGAKPHIALGHIPSCVFTIPPLSSVGMTEKQAGERGRVRVGRFPYRASGKAVSMSETEGMVKVIGDEKGKLLGMHILGAESSSLIGEAIVALDKGFSVTDITASIHPHPTLTEMIHEAAENFYKKAIHVKNE
ncbi:MAG: dihydrolipoyl dehydrogenase [candidate division WOR-3 bacterium]|nr:MAG: dihydrolipoyl dehydrogenase [candidate division WOR-3 bacterium]